ncbi:MAG: hypothetical protein Q9210_001039 [Variospora velana]
MSHAKKHDDRDYIVARQEQYVKTYRKGNTDELMKWMHPEDFIYSDFGGKRENMKHSEVKDSFHMAFNDFYDLKIKTLSLHGHKHFTAWEWEITCKPAKDENGNRLKKEDALPKKLLGCTLQWWDEDDKIVKNHDYVQHREP